MKQKKRVYFAPAEKLIGIIKECKTVREIELLMLLKKNEIDTYIAIEDGYKHDFNQVKYLQICDVTLCGPCYCIGVNDNLFRFSCEKETCDYRAMDMALHDEKQKDDKQFIEEADNAAREKALIHEVKRIMKLSLNDL